VNAGYVMVAIAATGWGFWPLVLRRAPMPGELQSTIMMAVYVLASVPVMARDRVRVRASLRDWLTVAWLGVADAGNVGFFFVAYQKTTVAIAVLTHYLTPIFVALAAPVLLGERLSRRTKGAVAMAFIGLVLLLEPWRGILSRNDVLGALFGATSALFYASNVLFTKRLSGVFSASELAVFHGFVAVPLLAAFVPAGAVAQTPASAIYVVMAGATVIGAAGGLLFVWGLRRIPASHASVLTLIEPFVAVVSAALFLGQTIGSLTIVGGALILGGALLVITARPRME
jgi:drug/metabolite transporter (DMT)-like permease